MAIGAIPRVRRLAASAVAAALLGSTLLPVAGQAQTVNFGWSPGPGAVAGTTIFGTVTRPGVQSGDNIRGGEATRITGWAYDASGSPIDGVQVWANGGPDTGGLPLTLSGRTGLNNTAAAEALGSAAALKSGFDTQLNPQLVGALLSPGSMNTLNVYVHSKNNGWWFKSMVVNVLAPLVINVQGGPVVTLLFPKDNDVLHQNFRNFSFQGMPRYTFLGYALDPNLPFNPDADPGNSAARAGVDRIQLWLDESKPGDKTTGSCLAGCVSGGSNVSYGALVGSGNAGSTQNTGAATASGCQTNAFNNGNPADNPCSFTPTSGALYGSWANLAGWSFGFNATSVPVGDHRVTVYARSSLTKLESWATAKFFVDCPGPGVQGPACSMPVPPS